jgi:hypothetical protein
VATVSTLGVILVQLSDQVVEVVVGLAGVGFDYGGVGGGVLGLDAGLFEVMDVAQFVVQSGQLASPASPWVLKYFVEYFTPFTGLLPLVRPGVFNFKFTRWPHGCNRELEASMSRCMYNLVLLGAMCASLQTSDGNLAGLPSPPRTPGSSGLQSQTPRAITALLQGGYWNWELTTRPTRIYSYSYVLAVLWVAGAFVGAWAVLGVWGRRVQPERPRHRTTLGTMFLWTLGRVTGIFLFLYALLSVTTVSIRRTWSLGTPRPHPHPGRHDHLGLEVLFAIGLTTALAEWLPIDRGLSNDCDSEPESVLYGLLAPLARYTTCGLATRVHGWC